MPGNCVFQGIWLTQPLFKDWIGRAQDKHAAHCKLCKKDFSIRIMGITALNSHTKGDKHKQAVRNLQQNISLHFLSSSSTSSCCSSPTTTSGCSSSTTTSACSSSSTTSTSISSSATSTSISSSATSDCSSSNRISTMSSSCTIPAQTLLESEIRWTEFQINLLHYKIDKRVATL